MVIINLSPSTVEPSEIIVDLPGSDSIIGTVEQNAPLVVGLPPLASLSNTLSGLLDVNTSGIDDKSLLIYDEDTETWVVDKTLDDHIIAGGDY